MKEINYEDLCSKVCEIARSTGRFIKKEGETFTSEKIEQKSSANDLVSYVDKEAEMMIVGALLSLIDGAEFITEESTTARASGKSRYCWVIDPLDGTTNFTHSMPPYCVSIALLEDKKPVVGVIYEVIADECFYAWKNSDAYLNGKKITVSETKFLTSSLIATGISCNSEDRFSEFHHQTEYLMRHTHGFRRIGSAAADLAYVACGRFDGFFQFNLSSWDVAAGALIVERAGGKVSDYAGGDNHIFGKEIIASNSKIYDDFVMLIDKTK